MASIKPLDVEFLDLDLENPRLPESQKPWTPRKALKYLRDNAVLEEIAQSLIDNGFFDHEPLIVLKEGRRYTVLEGNRRLAALKILFQTKDAQDLKFDFETPEGTVKKLKKVPCYEVDDREDVYRFLGFRHIGGIKTWSAEAKARYLTKEVLKAVKAKSDYPFKDVARRVGSNSQGVRNSYVALAILRHAHDEFGFNVIPLQDERFGVWFRALNSPDIRGFIGFGDPKEYEDIQAKLHDLDKEKLQKVFRDLLPGPGGASPVVKDSRDLTDYGRILAHPRASEVLEKHKDFELARQIIEEEDLPTRILRIKKECEILHQDVVRAKGTKELVEAAEELAKVAKAIHATAKELLKDDD